MNVLLLDQVLTFSSGILVSLVFVGLLSGLGVALVALLLVVCLIAQHLLLPLYPVLISKISWVVTRAFRKRRDDLREIHFAGVAFVSYYQIQMMYVAYWLLTAVALACLIYPLVQGEFLLSFLLLAAAVPASMLLGFLALWAPGGIGVRELVMVAVMSIGLPVEVGTAAAILFRVLAILVDLLLGGIAMIYFSRHELPGLSGEK